MSTDFAVCQNLLRMTRKHSAPKAGGTRNAGNAASGYDETRSVSAIPIMQRVQGACLRNLHVQRVVIVERRRHSNRCLQPLLLLLLF